LPPREAALGRREEQAVASPIALNRTTPAKTSAKRNDRADSMIQ
jgi:hypothetical protein